MVVEVVCRTCYLETDLSVWYCFRGRKFIGDTQVLHQLMSERALCKSCALVTPQLFPRKLETDNFKLQPGSREITPT